MRTGSIFQRERDLLTIGVFDGVHLGHKFLISKLVNLAHEQNLLTALITFRQHPRIYSAENYYSSYTLAEREQLLKNEGVDMA